jgi:hypothetical protein
MVVTRMTSPAQARAEAVERLVGQLETLVQRHRAAEQAGHPLSGDAELITGEVARYLAGAREALAGFPSPMPTLPGPR